MWVGGNLNIINQWGEPQNGGTKFLKLSGGKKKGTMSVLKEK